MAPSGVLVVVALLWILHRRPYAVLGLDEIETHLHPWLLDKVMELIQRMVIICDQDCDSGRGERLAKEVALAMRGLEQEPLQIVAFVSVECTENWLLCDGWPPDHRLCRGVSHPQHLGCQERKNQAKGIFDQLHGGGHQPRTKTARYAVQNPASGGLVRMRQAPCVLMVTQRDHFASAAAATSSRMM